MAKYQAYVGDCDFGVWEADSEESAYELICREAGYDGSDDENLEYVLAGNVLFKIIG